MSELGISIIAAASVIIAAIIKGPSLFGNRHNPGNPNPSGEFVSPLLCEEKHKNLDQKMDKLCKLVEKYHREIINKLDEK